MAHSIHVIVAPRDTADLISSRWPELPRLNRENGFALFPVNAALIDARLAPDKTPTVTGDEFMLVTNGFRSLLQELSCDGQLAYVETEYFGGVGGQGALVFRNGEEIMPPTWQSSGTINVALKLLGLNRDSFADRFTAAGLAQFRDDEQICDLIAAEAAKDDS